MEFPNKFPEEENIDLNWINSFLKRLEDSDISMHSMILMRHGHIVAETYYAPYTKDSLHRMFSIAKSLVSLAIGFLEDEGKLQLDDLIIDYFPDKLPAEVHPYLAAMTIRDMLRMTTCHSTTTYKCIPADDPDWVRSFFTVKPSHMPGTCFNYDTSSSHVLCALVERLTKKELLAYLREKCLDEIGFSKSAYMLKAPMGESMAGSGLMATSRDLLKIMYLVSRDGSYNGRQLLPREYLKAATALQTITYPKTQNYEEMHGYGYQIWHTTHNSIAFYGMAGQLAVYSPEKDMLLITTADTMGRNGGVQFIYDAYWQEVYDKVDVQDIKPVTVSKPKVQLSDRQLKWVSGSPSSPIASSIEGVRYILDENPSGFQAVSLELKDYNGIFTYENNSGVYSLNFGISCNEITQFPVYNQRAAVSGAWLDQHNFLIKAQIIDESIGNISILLTFKDETITLMMRKYEETLFNEFNGFITGHRM